MFLRPSLQVAVIMRRERVPGAMSHWQPWRWVLHDVVGHDLAPHAEYFGTAPQCLRQTEDEQIWLHPGFTVELFKDDPEGYYLNLTSPDPVGLCCGVWKRNQRLQTKSSPSLPW